jgi:para-aminobenzoate synthetase component I
MCYTADPKEIAEHNTIVDLMRNDIGMVAEDVQVERFRYIDRIKTHNGDILQVSSEITGRLPKDNLSHLGDIVFRMLPAGSVSGAPKQSTVNLIHKAEPETRGYYTGVFGFFDGSELDTAVLIRFIVQDKNKLFFHSGGGITIK